MNPSDGTSVPSSVTSGGSDQIVTSEPEEVGDLNAMPGPSVGGGHEKTASKLAYSFSAAIFVVFLLHTSTVFCFARHLQPELALEAINHVFSTWVPVFSGIVSAAVTYYFTQNRRR
jgi:hypothetical protein